MKSKLFNHRENVDKWEIGTSLLGEFKQLPELGPI